MATRFTTATVEKFIRGGVPAGKQHVSMRDGSGLVLRLRPNGTASWLYVYRVPGAGRGEAPRAVTVGAWPALEVSKAVEAAKLLTGKIAKGEDPRAERREAARRERSAVSVAIDDYEAWLISGKRLKTKTMISALRRGLAHLMKRDLAELDRRTLVEAIERILKDGRPGAAQDFRKHLVGFLERQVSIGTIPANPMAGWRFAAKTRDEKVEAEERARPLTEAEVAALWAACEGLGTFGRLARLALATGLRRGEAAALKWSWIDREAGRITIPAKSMKAGKVHVVPITPLVAAILDAQPNRGGDLVFASERRLGGDTMLSGWSKLMEKLRKNAGLPDFSGLHGLRRTFRSALADLGVSEPVAEAMIAHARPDLVARYNKAEQWEQRRAAALAYDGWLSKVVSRTDGSGAENVVSIASQRPKRGSK